MPLIIFEFRCFECGTVTDELVQPDVYETPCSACGSPAHRIVSAVRTDPLAFVHGPNASRPAIDKWEKKRQQKMGIEKRKQDEHGDSGW